MYKNRVIIFILFTVVLFFPGTYNPEIKDSLQKKDDVQSNSTTDYSEEHDVPVTTPESVESDETYLSPPHKDLQKGEQSKDIQALQNVLISIGYPIEITGQFDEYTTWAITDFQLQNENIYTTGIYESETREAIKEVIHGETTIDPGAGLSKPKVQQQEKPSKVIENPYEVLSLVNKQHALPADYIPNDLVIPNVRFPFIEDLPKKQLRKVAADALEEMFKSADKAGLDLFAQSGYRSYERQDVIFASNVSQHGEKSANNFSARPGESEHQSGLTMDITTPAVNYDLTIEFGDTKEGKWVQQHASDFGFIIRYPKGKEDITEYQYEPWHIRYVGKKAAKEITSEGITLEEYVDNIFSY